LYNVLLCRVAAVLLLRYSVNTLEEKVTMSAVYKAIKLTESAVYFFLQVAMCCCIQIAKCPIYLYI